MKRKIFKQKTKKKKENGKKVVENVECALTLCFVTEKFIDRGILLLDVIN